MAGITLGSSWHVSESNFAAADTAGVALAHAEANISPNAASPHRW
jgi:hypothetical protein